MPIKIEFDPSYNACEPTFVLATRSGVKLGAIPAHNVVVKDPLNSYTELVFCVYKELNGTELLIWDEIVDFKLVYCVEWDIWFEIKVEIDSGNETIKNISAKSLGEAELSQINLYDIEINTETDIMRDDYSPTILYQSDDTSASLLHRIMEKAPHYKIVNVDASLATMQRTFSFNGISLYDAFQEIAKELRCIFIINSGSNDSGEIAREISVYDLESTCKTCGHRGEFLDACPECGSTNIKTGYGEDTSIFVCTDNLADNIRYSTNTDSVKNCFRLVAGDDLMTATIVNCNPNGSGYIWYLSDETKADMSDELRGRLTEYDEQYDYYQNEHKASLQSDLVNQYNSKIANKYYGSSSDVSIPSTIVGYPALMEAYYNTIDANFYLEHGMMPELQIIETTAAEQARLLTAANISPVAVQNLEACSSATASNAVLGYARVIIDPRYRVRVNEGVLNTNNTWTGNFVVTSYSDEEDTATSSRVTVTISDDLEQFTKQKLEKALADNAEGSFDIVSLFDLGATAFATKIKEYCLTSLNSFRDSCQACLDILIESGAGDPSAWEEQDPNLYEELYLPYYEKLQLLNDEIDVRESEITIIVDIQAEIERERTEIQNALDFQSFVGELLWLEFAAYRRDDTYQNGNYISDGLDSSELFSNALEFIETAKKEIVRSATLQHSISATLKNLLVMKEFKPIVKYFQNGNWIRIQVDEDIYRLRLIDFEINFNDLDHVGVEFSDVCKVADGISDIESILNQAASMATSYDAVVRQADKGAQVNGVVSEWVSKGLDLTNTKIMSSADNQDVVWDKHGMLFRKYDPVTEEYDDCQLKIINSTLAITDDNWESVKTALGRYYYVDPTTGNEVMAYGIIAETIVGSLILGERLGIYSSNENLTFDENGLVVTDGTNTFQVDPSTDGILFRLANGDKNIFYISKDGKVNIDSDNVLISNESNTMSIGKEGLIISDGTCLFAVNPSSDRLLRIANAEEDVFYIDKDGKLHIVGDGTGIDISANATIELLNDRISTIVSGPDGAYSEISQRVDGIESRVQTVEGDYSKISQRADGIESRVETNEKNYSAISQRANGIETRVQTVEGNYSTLSQNVNGITTRVGTAEGNISTISQKVDGISLSVTDNSTSASISLKIGDKEEKATIQMNGLVKFSDLSTKGNTTISGDNITTGKINADLIQTGTLSADYVQLYGTFTVKSPNEQWDGGKIGYMTGNVSGTVTDGIGISDNTDTKYLVVTTGGVRMQASDTSLYVSPNKIGASQSISIDSDYRLKHNIDYRLDEYEMFYENLKPVSYRYNKNSDVIHTGFIAQDVKHALETAGLSPHDFAGLSAPESDDEMYALAYDEFISLNTHMIQKLMKRVDLLESHCYKQEA